MLRVLVFLCFLGLPCSALQLGVVTPARLSEAVRLAADNQTAHSQCTQDFSRWMAALSSEERWALEIADSWTKSVTGLLHGNTYDFGDFDECIFASSEKETQVTSGIIRGAYLLPSVSIICTNKSAVVSRTAQLLQELLPLELRMALCVPDSCGQDLMLAALHFVAKDLLSEEGLGAAFSATVSLPAGRLQTEANSFRPGWAHWTYLGLVVFLILLAVVSTILDIKLADAMESKTARLRWRYLLHFSLRSGMRRLLAPANPGSINSINGIRVMSTLWIMAGHTYDFQPSVINSKDTEKFNSALATRMLISYSTSVDTFLAIGGLVCCMSFMRAASKTNSFNWIKYIIHRYARTTPAVVFITLYGATWFNIAYPAADSYFAGEKSISHWFREYGWTSLLHISNFFGNVTNILPHIWYLSMDMQLYVLAPNVLIPLWKRPLLGKVFLAFCTLAACVIPGVLSVVYEYRSAGLGNHLNGYTSLKILTFGTESRSSPYLVGIAAGYFLHQFKCGGWHLKINKLNINMPRSRGTSRQVSQESGTGQLGLSMPQNMTKLKGQENWTTWKMLMLLFLQRQHLDSYLTTPTSAEDLADPESEGYEMDGHVRCCIAFNLEASVLKILTACSERAYDMWTALCASFENQGVQRRLTLLYKFLDTKRCNFKSLNDYVVQVRETFEQLNSSSPDPFIDEVGAAVVLRNLRPEDDLIKRFAEQSCTKVNASGEQILSFNLVVQRLFQEAQKEMAESASTALFANQDHRPGFASRGGRGGRGPARRGRGGRGGYSGQGGFNHGNLQDGNHHQSTYGYGTKVYSPCRWCSRTNHPEENCYFKQGFKRKEDYKRKGDTPNENRGFKRGTGRKSQGSSSSHGPNNWALKAAPTTEQQVGSAKMAKRSAASALLNMDQSN